jgi:hypothetical protein
LFFGLGLLQEMFFKLRKKIYDKRQGNKEHFLKAESVELADKIRELLKQIVYKV